MTDILRSGTRAAETMIGGMAGAFAYSVTTDGIPTGRDLVLILIVAIAIIALFILLHEYYGRVKGEPFH